MSCKQRTPRPPLPPPNQEIPDGGIVKVIAILALCISAAVIGFTCAPPAFASPAPRATGGILHGLAYIEEHEGSATVGLALQKGNGPKWASTVVHFGASSLDPPFQELVVRAARILSDEANAFFNPVERVALELRKIRLVIEWPGNDTSGGDVPARFLVSLDAVLR